MSDDLIKVIMNDQSQTVSPTVGAVGATVIKSTRGGNTPIKFQPKQSKRIIDYFGIPDTGNEAVMDVLEYNNSYPIWVSAPSTGGKYGGVLVTETGTVPFIGGKDSKTIDFAAITNTENVRTMDGLQTEVTFTISDYTKYVHGSLDILVNGVSVNVSTSDAEPEILTTTPDVGSGTYTRATGVMIFTFDIAPTLGTTIDVTYDTDYSDLAYFAVFNKNPQADDFKIQVESNASSMFDIRLYKKAFDSSSYNLVSGFPKTGSTIVDYKNGFGQNIYLPTLFEASDYIDVVVNTNLAFSIFTDDTTQVAFAGGVRGTTSIAELTAGWNYFKQTKYAADIFFDTTGDTVVPALFNTLRNSYQKYSYYICISANLDVSAAITAITGTMTDNKGIAFYWGWGKLLNSYTGKLIASSLQGRRALRLADMYDVFNGLAPAWFNENGTHGGQLGSGVVEMFYDADEEQQKLLEAARLNPTVMHPTFGCVLTRERTSQSLQSDYSSIGHVRLVDYLISNIVNLALPYQLYKLNDFDHRTRVKSQIEKIIQPVASPPFNLLRDFQVQCDSENNNDEVLAREEFVVAVAIKFTPFSKTIIIYFTNVAQGTSVTEAL